MSSTPVSPVTVVVGSGLAGLTTTLELITHNHKVVLLEKTDRLGGNSAKASLGINGCPTIYQHNEDTVEAFRDDTIKSGKGLSDLKLVDVLTLLSKHAIEWLTQQNKVDLSLVAQLGGHSFARTHKGSGKLPPGFAIIQALSSRITELQTAEPNILTILKNSQLEKIIYNQPNLKVKGVQYKDANGSMKTLETTNIVLATGGFVADSDQQALETSLLNKYRPDLLKFPTSNGEQTTGDGQKIAERDVNAALIHMDQIQIHPTGFINPKDVNCKWKFLCGEVMRGIGGILLSPTGERFVNELSTRDIVTEYTLDNCEIKRENELNLPVGSFASVLVVSEDDATKAANHVGFYKHQGLLQQGTITDLLELLKKLDPENAKLTKDKLQTTLDEYNNAIVEGKDATLGRTVFGHVFTKQFFFGLTTPVLHFAMGGVKIDEHARVYDKKDNIIEGLYAVGEVSGGLHGGNRLGGSSLLESVVFGKQASAHILARVESRNHI
ncbi:conserved hypothetical protein [Lodderomyces elongisporus NRRL YB-4239]|uniref:Fumarate reductase n=1 Tax=Lodderomyces elongisporus (strain ATCC 11503 / CBS 2605 / JCM 1781 / NBRC 1676 / NRRL YB-4239) TaxID=379508 RepID=A5DUI2_LODEL|nr:conserved hypothetical protein [Lodderomyces elongisporus NRRL YB-4239]